MVSQVLACLMAIYGTGAVQSADAASPTCSPDGTHPPPAGDVRSTPRRSTTPTRTRILLRINQVGYVVGCPKSAIALSSRLLTGARFVVEDTVTRRDVLSGELGRSRGRWSSRWAAVYRIDLSRVDRPGRYVVVLAGHRSPVLRVATGTSLYAPLTSDAVSFFQAQRDGPAVIPGALDRRPSHLSDASATVYRTPIYAGTALRGRLIPTSARVDVSGGWFDAGDYLKFVETGSFADALVLLALRDHAGTLGDGVGLAAEARFETDWLLRMWDQTNRVLHYQVGIGDGNDQTVLGDHDFWRLPQVDDALRPSPRSPAYYVSHRPVFNANSPGASISPNLAGRLAGVFALCAQVFATTDTPYARICLRDGQSLYDQADTSGRGRLLAATPRAYYNEPEWRDDLEFGATELYLATQTLGPSTPSLPHQDLRDYLDRAGHWADAYITSKNSGSDSLNLYDVSTLADTDLVGILNSESGRRLQSAGDLPTSVGALLSDRRDQLRLAQRLAAADPLGLANPATNVDTVPHALGYAIEARLYDQMTHSDRFESLAQDQLGWVLGANAWGSSFVVGAGTRYPHCLAHQVANLAGSLGGSGAILRGATVDGPTAPRNVVNLGAPDGYRRCPSTRRDPLASFDGHGFTYLDDVRSADTSEPSIDYAALMLLASAQQAAIG